MKPSIIVIGASAGGVTALSDLLGKLRPDFSSSIFVVLHTSTGSCLPAVLQRSPNLVVNHAMDGEKVQRAALASLRVDYVLPAAEIGLKLNELLRGKTKGVSMPGHSSSRGQDAMERGKN